MEPPLLYSHSAMEILEKVLQSEVLWKIKLISDGYTFYAVDGE